MRLTAESNLETSSDGQEIDLDELPQETFLAKGAPRGVGRWSRRLISERLSASQFECDTGT
jgi:hypothetical protein